MSAERPDARLDAALRLVDSPFLDRPEQGLTEEERESFEVIAALMAECHAMSASRSAPRKKPSFLWGPIEVYEEVGRGSFGTVHRARDPRLDIDVALKLQTPDADAHALIAEARRHAQVRHCNVSAVLGVDVHDERVGMWSEYIEGRTLADRVEKDGPLSVPEVVRMGSQLARALHAVHEVGLVHGDVSATNVIETPDGRVVLTDFGSSISGTAIPRTGTPVAMAPELFEAGDVSSIADVYATGALLFYLLTGTHAVPGDDLASVARAHRRGDRRSLSALRDDVPMSLRTVVDRAIAPFKEDRLPSASALLRALMTSGTPPHNLPVPATGLVGRDAELTEVGAALGEERLVTLTGVGGVGKTRLALEVSRERIQEHPDGVWLVELDDVSDGPGVASAIAGACDGLDGSRGDVESIFAGLADRRLLLVLDNCEHVRATVAELCRKLLATASRVTILCTSRVALGLPAEHRLVIEPLVVDVGASNLSAAGTLFLERVSDRAMVAAAAYSRVNRICDLVDGIPLAIELAATRAQSIGLVDLEVRLRDRIGVLSASGAHPERHRTLDALVAWSVDLLDERTAGALAALGVFPGSFDTEAAEAVLSERATERGEPIRALASLEEASLVDRFTRSTESSRYRLLVPVRTFAARMLEEGDTSPRVRIAHRDHFERRVLEQTLSLEAINADYHNVHLAMDGLLRDADGHERAAKLAVALFDYWFDRGSRDDARAIVERLLREGSDLPATPASARIEYLAGILAWDAGNQKEGRAHFEEALRCYRALDMPLEASKALSALGTVAGMQDRQDDAIALLEQSIDGYRRAGEVVLEAEAHNNIGSIYLTAGEHDRARHHFDLAVPALRAPEGDRVLALTLMNVARLEELAENEASAAAHLEEASQAAMRASDHHTAALADVRRGEVLAKSGELAAAVSVLELGIGRARSVSDARTIAFAQCHLARCGNTRDDADAALAEVAACLSTVSSHAFPGRDDMIRLGVREAGYALAVAGEHEPAGRLLAWSHAEAERLGRTIGPHERQRHAAVDARLRAALGSDWRVDALGTTPGTPENAIALAGRLVAAGVAAREQ